MDPILTGALISGGAKVLGGLVGSKDDGAMSGKAIRRSRINTRQQLGEQRDHIEKYFESMVQGARNAGLHPLSVLGSNVSANTAPITVSGSDYGTGEAIQDMGQDIGRAVQARQTANQRKAEQLSLLNLEAQTQKEYAIAAYYNSEAARRQQTGLQTAPLPVQPRVKIRGESLYQENVPAPTMFLQNQEHMYNSAIAEPNRLVSAQSDERYRTPGTNPMFNEYTLNNGLKVMLPQNEEGAGEAMESLWNPVVLLATLRANEQAYGKEGAKRIIRYILTGRDQNTHPAFKR